MIRVRFAPSPTGLLHLGGLRSALINYLFSKQSNNSVFILRLEDTDRDRFKPESYPDIIKNLEWAGIIPDEGPELGGDYGPYVQSERLKIYEKMSNKLLDQGLAYRCFCCEEEIKQYKQKLKLSGVPYKYDKRCRSLTQSEINTNLSQSKSSFCLRIKNKYSRFTTKSGNSLSYMHKDLVFNNIKIDHEKFDDFVILKRDGFPTYHLASVVDDHLMQITHVLRGEEWLNSIQLHLLLYEAFDWEPPKYAHLPLIYDKDGLKISKRKNNEYSVTRIREDGYLPKAVNTFLMNIGYNSFHTSRTALSNKELAATFDIKRLSKGNPHLDISKLNWFNQKLILKLDKQSTSEDYTSSVDYVHKAINNKFKETAFDQEVLTRNYAEQILNLTKGRINNLKETVDFVPYMFAEPLVYERAKLIQILTTMTYLTNCHIGHAFNSRMLKESSLEEQQITSLLAKVAQEDSQLPDPNKSTHYVYHMIRYALTAREIGPPLQNIIKMLGKTRCIERMDFFTNNILKNTTKIMQMNSDLSITK